VLWAADEVEKVEPVWGLTPEQWDVLTSVVTAAAFVLGALVALIAYRQLQHSRTTHRDQTRPYVMVTVEQSKETFHMLDLVIRNVGTGPALNLRLKATPPMTRAKDDEYPLWKSRIFNDPIPMLPPAYRLATFFDNAIDRDKVEKPLPSSHTVQLTYEDSSGHKYEETQVVDVTLHDGLLFGEVFGTNHVAQSLREMEKLFKEMNKHLKNPLAVTTEDRDEYEARVRAEAQARREQMRQGRERLAAAQAAAAEAASDGDTKAADGVESGSAGPE
jgi:hypothetical protein